MIFKEKYFPCYILLILCSYHVTHAFQSESTLSICLNVKELLVQNRGDIRSLSDCNETRTHNHLVRNRTLNHLTKLASLAKCMSVRNRTKWLCSSPVAVPYILLPDQISLSGCLYLVKYSAIRVL